MRTASEIRIEYMLKTGGLCSSNIEAAINTARREALEDVLEIMILEKPENVRQSIFNLIKELK